MALVSPGVEVSIIDESQYTSAATNTVPYILLATELNKLDSAGTAIAKGTLQSNSDNVFLVTSQRELVNTFGEPLFQKTNAGNAIHAHELNEYGLMAAYSVLGVSNRAYIQRVDVDTAELKAALIRPKGEAANGTYWYDLAESTQGYFVWNSVTNSFDVIDMLVINDLDELVSGLPAPSVGNIGSYAVITANANNPAYFKNKNNDWVLLGSDEWKASLPIVIGTEASPALTATDSIDIDGTTVVLSGTTIASLVSDITTAAIAGVTAAEVNNKLELYKESEAVGVSADSSVDVTLTLADNIGAPLADLGLIAGSYAGLIVQQSSHITVPRWRATDVTPRPAGSIWFKTTDVNEGAHIVIKRYDSTTGIFVEQPVPIYKTDEQANKNLDPGTGGRSIPVGDTYAQVDVNDNDTATLKIFKRSAGATSITGSVQNPVLTPAQTFTISVSAINSGTLTAPVTITMGDFSDGLTAADFVADLLGAGIANIEAAVTANGSVQITHTAGGVILLDDSGPIAVVGISETLENVRLNNLGELILSNWNVLTYTADSVAPGQDPVTGTRWYYSEISDVDIMIHDGSVWKGYRNVNNDTRGFDLTLTDLAGPQVSATAPDFQSDGTDLVKGDLWIDTSDLENYPILYRWETENLIDQWVQVDNADQTTTNGILFADARWAGDGTTDPITDDLPSTVDLLNNDEVDPDAPDKDLYPDGMLLWNTRRSGFNVKEFRVNYFNASDFDLTDFPLLTEANAWVTVSGHKDDGSANMGRHAQRALIVSAMKSAIDTNADIREEQRTFDLLAAPGYPELIPNMIALNNERRNTAFVVGDSPLRLANTGTDILEWATNNSGLGLSAGDGLVSNDEYMGAFYPSGQTTDLAGTSIVVPPSHMMLRTIIHSDEQAYPWIAPAGIRRGIIDNASAIGYVDAVTGEFKQMLTRQGIRDVLYSNNVNPITFVPGAGIINDGNKTTSPGTALDRINVARLTSYIRVQLEDIGRQFVHEPNDKLTRDELKGQIERMLNDLVAKRGLFAYVVVCDESNNTPTRIDRNELYADIAIEPVKAAEFIFLPVRLKNTGEISG